MSQAKPPFKASPPPTSSQVATADPHVVKGTVRVAGAEATRHGDSPDGVGGRGDLRIDTIQ